MAFAMSVRGMCNTFAYANVAPYNGSQLIYGGQPFFSTVVNSVSLYPTAAMTVTINGYVQVNQGGMYVQMNFKGFPFVAFIPPHNPANFQMVIEIESNNFHQSINYYILWETRGTPHRYDPNVKDRKTITSGLIGVQFYAKGNVDINSIEMELCI